MAERVITAKRNPKTGDLFYHCPSTGEKIINPTPGSKPCCSFCTIEWLPTKFRVHSTLSTLQELIEFDPPKAHDTYRGLSGMDLTQSADHVWIEPKLDGARAIVHCTPTGVVITSRRRNKAGEFNQFQDNIPHIKNAPILVELGKVGYTIFDGEIIMPSDTDSLALTMSVVGAKPETAIATQELKGKAKFVVFDVHTFKGAPLFGTSFNFRRKTLEDFFFCAHHFDYIELIKGFYMTTVQSKVDLVNHFLTRGFEGAVLKNPQAGYFDSRAWLKVKQKLSIDCLVTGFESGVPGGKYEGTIGALKLSVLNSESGELQEIALAIPGDDTTRSLIYQELWNLDSDRILELDIICEVEAQLITKDGRLRHPRISSFRPDLSQPNRVDFVTCQVVR